MIRRHRDSSTSTCGKLIAQADGFAPSITKALMRMIRAFRTLIVFSIVALGVALALPLQHTVHIRISLSAPPPAVLFIAPAMLLVGVAMLAAAVALLMFRRWGRWLGTLALLGGLAVFWFASAQDADFALAASAQVLLVLSALTWLGCLLASHHPEVAARFQHAR